MAPAKRAVKQKKTKPASKAGRKSAVKAASKAAVKATGKSAVPGRVPAVPSRRPAAGQAGRTSKQVATVATPDLYSSLHALLHTMRLIEQHDEPLCSMHDELKRTGRLSAAQRRRLQQLVLELPAEDYQADLDTLRQAVGAAQTAGRVNAA